MTRALAALAAAALLAAAPFSGRAADDAALRAAAEAYVRHPVVQQTIDGMWSGDTMRGMIAAITRARGLALGPDRTETLTRILGEEFARIRPRVEALLADAAVETYTVAELGALTAFYDTELGARATVKSGEVMRSFNARSAPVLRGLFERLGEGIRAELEE